MPTGSCFCGNITLEYTGEPEMAALCHCVDCRKISGGNYSSNFLVPADRFKVTSGNPKEISKTADSGKKITSCFCGDCGTTLYRYSESFGGIDGLLILKTGVIDDLSVVNNTKPGAELFAPERVKWLSATEGANQVETMPPS